MSLMIAFIIVLLIGKNAFLGTNAIAFIGDIILVIILANMLNGCRKEMHPYWAQYDF